MRAWELKKNHLLDWRQEMASTRSENPADLILPEGLSNESLDYVLGPEEVARILDRSPHDVTGLAREGKLRARRMGTRWKFRHDDVITYLTGLSQFEKSI